MTANALRNRLIGSGLFIATIILISLIEYSIKKDASNTFIGSNATLFALLAAAYLAYCFQQRGKFIDDLRKWWREIVEAKSSFFIYCDKTEPEEDDYFLSFYKLSTAMDALRLIYCNVERSKDNPKGYYPFEQVRDIIDIARSVHPSKNPTADDRLRAKQAINVVFQSLRHAMQDESQATVPDNPTLYKSPYRRAYFEELKRGFDFDIQKLREANRKADYFSKREK